MLAPHALHHCRREQVRELQDLRRVAAHQVLDEVVAAHFIDSGRKGMTKAPGSRPDRAIGSRDGFRIRFSGPSNHA